MNSARTYQERLRQAAETPFPPTSAGDVKTYRHEEIMDGYCGWRLGDDAPGPNHSSSFRWGWLNRQRDSQRTDDGYDAIRHEASRLMSSGVAEGDERQPLARWNGDDLDERLF